MTLPDLSTRLECAIDRFEMFDVDGSRSLAIVIKQRFQYGLRGAVDRVPGAQVEPVDVPWPDGQSAMYPSDLFLRKASTDVVVAGSAVAPGPVKSLDVMVRVGPVHKTLRVFGERVWYGGVTGMKPGDPAPFERLPLMWEHAYGGMDISDPDKAVQEPRNPVGRGVACHASTLDGQPVPRIEDPNHLIHRAGNKPPPAGIAALAPHFEPRRGFAGTFDQRWQDERMPLFPLDFDERFNQVAHPDLITPQPLIGGEPVQLLNLGAPVAADFALPRLVFQVDAYTSDGMTGHRPMLDTVVLMPDERRFDLVWRTALPLRYGPARIREIRIYEKRMLR